MKKYTQKFYNVMIKTSEKYKMFSDCQLIVAGVSGGSDSVAMLILLNEYCKKSNITLIGAHFNHMLREKEADLDEETVSKLCAEMNVEFISKRMDVKKIAGTKGIEEVSRILRYDFFNEIIREKEKTSDIKGISRIAVAHNFNDRAETILFNISRGCGLDGLKGIPYTRDNIIRPLLDIKKLELNEICRENDIEYRTDMSNFDESYKRNKIRHSVISYLNDNLDTDIEKRLIDLANISLIDNDFLGKYSYECYKYCTKSKDNVISIKISDYLTYHEAIRNRIIRYCLCDIKNNDGEYVFPDNTGIDNKSINRINDCILNGKTGISVDVLKNVVCVKSYENVFLKTKNRKTDNILQYELHLVKFDISQYDEMKKKYSGRMCEFFDSDKLDDFTNKKELVVRNRLSGDEFSPFGMNGTVKIKKYFIDNKIPKEDRGVVPLVAVENRILWIVGIRRSNVAAIDCFTKNGIILELIIKD